MRHFASPRFWEEYDRLPADVRKIADKNFTLLKQDPRHRSLNLKRAGRYWSVRIGRAYRALAVDAEGGLLWFWIGTHAEYDALIRNQ
jgi:hypothetical protein